MSKKNRPMKIPSSDNWVGYDKDLDLKDLYRLVFGKRVEDIYYYFKNWAYVSRADELLHANRKVFQYYIYAFALYIISIGKEDIDAQYEFLKLLKNREERDRGSMSQIYCINRDFEIIDESFNKQYFSFSFKSLFEQIIKKLNQNENYDDITELTNYFKSIIC